uniref:Uncharacterized protein MANES_18G010500 n=1 Tax=Rhizophora mucronata TaxID=61149 RepID=A0A2P2QBJ6_RHIMU
MFLGETLTASPATPFPHPDWWFCEVLAVIAS